MRIWSLHPKYLDSKGLVALWRETLLAKHVLEGRTRGYQNHPQLVRFKAAQDPLNSINQYLAHVLEEAMARGYNFDARKIEAFSPLPGLTVTKRQIAYERTHLLKKLKIRDTLKYELLKTQKVIEAHPLLRIVDGEVESWEVVSD